MPTDPIEQAALERAKSTREKILDTPFIDLREWYVLWDRITAADILEAQAEQTDEIGNCTCTGNPEDGPCFVCEELHYLRAAAERLRGESDG